MDRDLNAAFDLLERPLPLIMQIIPSALALFFGHNVTATVRLLCNVHPNGPEGKGKPKSKLDSAT